MGKKTIVKKGTIAVMEKVVVSWEVKGNVQRLALEFALQISLDKTSTMMKHLHLNWWTQHPQLRPSISQAHRSLYLRHERKTVALLCSLTSLITLQTPCLELKFGCAD